MVSKERAARASAAPVAVGVLAALCVATIVALGASTYWTTHSVPVERVRPNVTVADLQIGGVTREDVSEAVRERLRRYADSQLTLTLGDSTIWMTAAELGYRPEVEATIAQIEALAVPLQREALIAEWSGSAAPRDIRPSFSIDEARLARALDALAARVDRPAHDAELRVLPDVTVATTPARPGQRLSRDEATRRIRATMSALGSSVSLPVETVAPAVTDEAARVAREAAERFMAAPLEVRAGDLRWTLERGDLASWVIFERGPADGVLRLALHPERPRNWIVDRADAVYRPARDARLTVEKGLTRVTQKEEPGQELDQSGALAALLRAGTNPERRLELPVKTIAPAVTSSNVAKLSFPDLLAEASTAYGGSIPERNHNVELAASRLNGVVVAPGDVFSFNRSVGRTRIKDGYKVAYGIAGGDDGVQTVPSVAGGICQVATTLFHAAFWAGLPIVERSHHLYWIPKYGAPPKGLTGLDATVDEDAGLDFRFRNSTDQPLLIQTSTDGTRVTFRLHGTRAGWEVTTTGPTLSNWVKSDSTLIRQEDATLAVGRAIQVEEARDGFDAAITRRVTRGTTVVDELEVRSHYVPSRNVLLVGTRR